MKELTVWVDFLHVPVTRIPLCCGVKSVSKNGIEPSDQVCSTVNLMALSMLLMCLKKFSCSVCCITTLVPCVTHYI